MLQALRQWPVMLVPTGGGTTKLFVVLLALLGQLSHSSAEAQSALQSVEQILPGCRDFIQPGTQQPTPDAALQFLAGICAGKVSALLNVSTILQPQFRFCRPEGVTLAQTIEVIVKRLDGQPELSHQSFDAAALATLVGTWPCR
jgi:Ssp1 endopeptidase immunity protein Rap1a